MSSTNASRETLLTPNTIISGNFSSYLIKEFKGEGTYARVVRCVDLSTKDDVALKMYRPGLSRAARHEADLLRQLRRHSRSKNIVGFIDSFQYQDHYCLVLEHLDRSLFDYIQQAENPTHVGDIRYVAEQVLVALRELEKRGLVHADLKPDNVMLVNQPLEPFRVKLIDLGMTVTRRRLLPGATIQASRYRAPEVYLGTEVNGAVDMWALGCVLAYLYLGENLFPYRCDYQIMRALTQMCGMPDLLQLEEGLFTQSFFTKQDGEYRLKTLEEYNARAARPTTHCSDGSFRRFGRLEDMMEHRPAPQTDEEEQETRQFFHLLRQLLQVNPAKRISAGGALRHPFITQRYESKMSVDTHQKGHDRVVNMSRVAENGVNKNSRMDWSMSTDDSGMGETSTKERSVMGRICRFFRQKCTSCINVCVVD